MGRRSAIVSMMGMGRWNSKDCQTRVKWFKVRRQKNFKGCSVNNVKKYLASQHGIDSQALDATIKPIMKMTIDRNILKNLADTWEVSECRKRRKSSGGGKKRRKSSGGKKKRKKSRGGKKNIGKRRRKKSKKGAVVAK
ncbi:hypothetical protein AVEN_40509-1 [Araneus ventricosus]|uniref:H15 domain-containing protein n=1 Tax=Araneus ventricosus TaxID=182803 RepID=A0A4Y2IMR8_ARAVE|nr:hypothetical protein AVEN_40509-1 [Araneus ventricosus]